MEAVGKEMDQTSMKTFDQTCEGRRGELCLITLFIAYLERGGGGVCVWNVVV